MKIATKLTLVGMLLFAFAACSKDDSRADESSAGAENSASESASSDKGDKSMPCDLLTEEQVREVLDVPDDLEFEISSQDFSTVPNCGWAWFPEEGMRELSLFVASSEDPEDARKGFDRGLQEFGDSATEAIGEQTVEGLGDDAYFADVVGLQVTVLDGTFNVTVSIEDALDSDEERAAALVEIAKLVLPQLAG